MTKLRKFLLDHSHLHFPSISGSNYLNIQSNMELKNALAQFNANNTILSMITDINEHGTSQ